MVSVSRTQSSVTLHHCLNLGQIVPCVYRLCWRDRTHVPATPLAQRHRMFLQGWILHQAILDKAEAKDEPTPKPEVPVFFRAFESKSDATQTSVTQKDLSPVASCDKNCKACAGRGRANLAFYMACRMCNGTGLDPAYQQQQEREMEELKEELGDLGELVWYPFLKQERKPVRRPSSVPPLRLSGVFSIEDKENPATSLLAPRKL